MHISQLNISSLSLMAWACISVLVNWDEWEGYRYGRRTLILLSVKSLERVHPTFLGIRMWMKNAVHGKQGYLIFLSNLTVTN